MTTIDKALRTALEVNIFTDAEAVDNVMDRLGDLDQEILLAVGLDMFSAADLRTLRDEGDEAETGSPMALIGSLASKLLSNGF